MTVPAAVAATAILAEVAEDLVRSVRQDFPGERFISLLAISVSHLAPVEGLQLEFGLGLADEKRRPGAQGGAARWQADRAMDAVRGRFGWEAIGYGSVVLEAPRAVPDAFRELAEKDL